MKCAHENRFEADSQKLQSWIAEGIDNASMDEPKTIFIDTVESITPSTRKSEVSTAILGGQGVREGHLPL